MIRPPVWMLACLLLLGYGLARGDVLPPGTLVRQSIVGERFAGDYYYTVGSPKKLGILVLGGSEGGKPSYMSETLCSEGNPVLSLAYFGDETPNEGLAVPLEYFDSAIAWLQKRPETGHAGIVVWGGSRGAELALLLASRKSEIRGVIAQAPSSVVWPSLPWARRPGPTWYENGIAVPAVPYAYEKTYDLATQKDIYETFSRSLQNRKAVDKASLQVEKINGPLLLFSGLSDEVWPSAFMADAIVNRLREKNFRFPVKNVKYPDAGHTLYENFLLGGTHGGNFQARLDMNQKVFEFIDTLESQLYPPAKKAGHD